MIEWFLRCVTGLILLVAGCSCGSAQTCRVVNLMPAFWPIVDGTSNLDSRTQVMLFHNEIVRPNGDLYGPSGFGFQSETELDKAIIGGVSHARSHSPAMKQMESRIASALPNVLANLRRTFPDFRCTFPIYLAPSLGTLDGAGRIIMHHPALVIGVDQAADEYTDATLPIFLTHELFHRYHSQVAGFSDDAGERAILWKALWAEGLATYVSMKLNAGATLQDALILPRDLVLVAQPRLAELVGDLLPYLDERNHTVFAEFFEYHPQVSKVPARAGYYLGALVAQRLNESSTLMELAHERQPMRSDVRRTLMQLGAGRSH